MAELTLGEFVLSFTAGVEPEEVTVGGEDVTGVVYTIKSAECLDAG